MADAHDEEQSSVTFVHSGLSAFYYPRLRLTMRPGFEGFKGKKLSRRMIRKFLWQAFRGTSSPTSLPRTIVVWTTYDAQMDNSYVGEGVMAASEGALLQEAV